MILILVIFIDIVFKVGLVREDFKHVLLDQPPVLNMGFCRVWRYFVHEVKMLSIKKYIFLIFDTNLQLTLGLLESLINIFEIWVLVKRKFS